MKVLWHKLWFPPESALNLAAARVLFSLHSIWVLLSRRLPDTSGFPEPFWHLVPDRDLIRYLIHPGNPALEWTLQWIAIAALSMALIGVFPRISCFVSGLLLYHLAPLETIFWTPGPYERGLTVDVLVLLTLSASRCGDALSILHHQPSADPKEYGWALRLIQFHLAAVYLLAGVSKIRRVGLDWISAANMRGWLLDLLQEDQVRVFDSVGYFLAANPALLWAMAVGAILVDVGFVIAVFWPVSRRVLLPAAALGHFGILLTMNIFFINLPQLLVFVNWSWLRTRCPFSQPLKCSQEIG